MALQFGAEPQQIGIELEQVVGRHESGEVRRRVFCPEAAAEGDPGGDAEFEGVSGVQPFEGAHAEVAAVAGDREVGDDGEAPRLDDLELHVQRQRRGEHVKARAQVGGAGGDPHGSSALHRRDAIGHALGWADASHLERHRHRRVRRHRRRRGQPLLFRRPRSTRRSRTSTTTDCPWKGAASLPLGDRRRQGGTKDAAWFYPEPKDAGEGDQGSRRVLEGRAGSMTQPRLRLGSSSIRSEFLACGSERHSRFHQTPRLQLGSSSIRSEFLACGSERRSRFHQTPRLRLGPSSIRSEFLACGSERREPLPPDPSPAARLVFDP